MTEKKILVFTGGGSGGHVMPALTLIQNVNSNGEFEVHYLGGISSIERDLVASYKLSYHPIHTGKLRRYLSIENLKDIFKIFLGLFDSWKVLALFSKKNTLVFSTGGFVSVPVVIAAFFQGKKIFIHEQTSRVGLANKICSLFADKIFVSFEESLKYFNPKKTYYSGYPLRAECYSKEIRPVIINNKNVGSMGLPVLFVTGGGNGAQLINKLIERNFKILTQRFIIVHQTGKAFIEYYKKLEHPNYFPVSFIGPEMIDLFKLAQVTVSRAGAGTVCELMAIGKKSIFIPLKIAQKNEQYFNALEANRKLGSIVIEESNLTDEIFLKSLHDLKNQSQVKEIHGVDSVNGIAYLAKEIHNSLS